MAINVYSSTEKETTDAIQLMHKGKPVVYREWQKTVQKGRRRFTVVAVHRRAGKSVYACAEIISAALIKKGTYAYISPLKRQSQDNVWNILLDMLSGLIDKGMVLKRKDPNIEDLVSAKPYEGSIKLYNGSVIRLYGTDNPHALRGTEFHGLIMDEVAQMKREAWFEALRPTIIATKGWVLFIGTPYGIDLFSELYYRGLNPAKPDWASFKFTCYETNAIDAAEIESIADEDGGKDSNTFKREMLCDFNASGPDQILSLSEIQKSIERSPEVLPSAPLIMGVDVAGMGDDASVLCIRKGTKIIAFHKYHELTLHELAHCINRVIFENHGMDYVMIDSTGLGAGLVDILLRQGCKAKVFDVNFASKPYEKRYANRRAEMWFRMAHWIKHTGNIPDDYDLIKDLCGPTYFINDRGSLQLEKKADIKKRLGSSPDMADALALTFAEVFDEYEKPMPKTIQFAERNDTTFFGRYADAVKKRDSTLWDRLF